MVKTDVTSDDSHDQEAFGAFLIFVLFVGPSMAIVEPFFEFVRAAIRRAPSSRHHEEDTHQHFLSHIEIYYRGKPITVGEFENKFSEVLQKEKSNEGHGDSSREATPEQTYKRYRKRPDDTTTVTTTSSSSSSSATFPSKAKALASRASASGEMISVKEVYDEVDFVESQNTKASHQSQSSATSGAMWEAKKMEREEAPRRKELRRSQKARRESEILSQRLREQLNTAAWKDESKGDTHNDQNDALQNVSLTTTMDTTVRDTTGEETGWVQHQRLHTSGRKTRFSAKYNLNELNPKFGETGWVRHERLQTRGRKTHFSNKYNNLNELNPQSLPLRGSLASPNVSQRSHYASSRAKKSAFKAAAPNDLMSPTARPSSLSEKVCGAEVVFHRETMLPTSATIALASETTTASKTRRRENSLDRIGHLWI